MSLLWWILSCSHWVKHIVKQWLFCELLVILWGSYIFWVYHTAQQSQQNKAFLNMYGWPFGITFIVCTSTETFTTGDLSFHDQNRYLNVTLNEEVSSDNNAAFSFSSRYLALQFLANTVTTAEHLWWMENRRLDFSFASSLFFREFGNNVCNANKDTSKNGLLAFSMVEMFHCAKISMIGFWAYFFIALETNCMCLC